MGKVAFLSGFHIIRTRFGYVASEKGADTGLGLRMQPNKSFNRNYTMMPCHHQNLPTAGTAEFGLQGCCNGNGDCGPLFFDTSNQLSNSSSITHNINDVVGAGNVLPKTQLHHPNSDIFSFNSSGKVSISFFFGSHCAVLFQRLK